MFGVGKKIEARAQNLAVMVFSGGDSNGNSSSSSDV
jgi:hypothetical protein